MSVIYEGKTVKVSESKTKLNVDLVYARPEDKIELDFLLKNVRVTFVNGDLNFIFSNGSMITFASFGELAFDSDAPKMYDANGILINIEDLLQKVQVLKPEDTVLILANRDGYKLVHNTEEVNRIVVATYENGDKNDGNPIAGAGTKDNPTTGVPSDILDETGTVFTARLRDGLSDHIKNAFHSNARGPTDTDNNLPGNTTSEKTANLTFKFLYGDGANVVSNKYKINGNPADYFGVQFGINDDTDSEDEDQLNQIDFSTLANRSSNHERIFDTRSADHHVRRFLHLDYTGGIFPTSIVISGIPKDLDSATLERIFKLELPPDGAGTTEISYSSQDGTYTLSHLDPLGKINLVLDFLDTAPDYNFEIQYTLSFYNEKTGKNDSVVSFQRVMLKTITKHEDLISGTSVLSKTAAGFKVNDVASGPGDKIYLGGGVRNDIESCQGGNSLVFSGLGHNHVDINFGSDEDKDLIYASTGYNMYRGSGHKGKGGEKNIYDATGDWLVFNNDAGYNTKERSDFKEGGVLKPEYYNTVAGANNFQFYFGVKSGDQGEDSVKALYNKLGINDIEDDGSHMVQQAAGETHNFVYNYFGVSAILDRNGNISIPNVVTSGGSDVVNLYFKGVAVDVNIYSGGIKLDASTNKDTFNNADNIQLVADKGDKVTVDLGVGAISSEQSSQSHYTYQTNGVSKIVGGKEDDYIKVDYNEHSCFRVGANYYDAGEGTNNTVDFGGLGGLKSIQELADGNGGKNNNVLTLNFNSSFFVAEYQGFGLAKWKADGTLDPETSKQGDIFYHFNTVIGSTGKNIFNADAGSGRSYKFVGTNNDNTLSYARSTGDLTFDTRAINNNCYVYKVYDERVTDFSKYKGTADQLHNIQNLELGASRNEVIGSMGYQMGSKGGMQVKVGSNATTIRYDVDEAINNIEVFADGTKGQDVLAVEKCNAEGSSQGEDRLLLGPLQELKIIGSNLTGKSKGSNIFHGGAEYNFFFQGGDIAQNLKASDDKKEDHAQPDLINILDYSAVKDHSLNFDLSAGAVSKIASVDHFNNIQSIVGGKGGNTFSLGDIDITKKEERVKFDHLSIDGNSNQGNTVSFANLKMDNLNDHGWALIYNVSNAGDKEHKSGSALFFSKQNPNTPLTLKLDIKHIQGVEGVNGYNKFISAGGKDFVFQGGGNLPEILTGDPKKDIYGNTISYEGSDLNGGVKVDVFNGIIYKDFDGSSYKHQDSFRNVSGFIGAQDGGNRFVSVLNKLENHHMFDGNSQGDVEGTKDGLSEKANVLDYSQVTDNLDIDFIKGQTFLMLNGQRQAEHDTFFNINTFIGSTESQVHFKVTQENVSFNRLVGDGKQTITLVGGTNKANNSILDFSAWGNSLGTKDHPFVVNVTGSIAATDRLTYQYNNFSNFIFTKDHDDYVVVTDVDNSYSLLDANGSAHPDDKTAIGNVLDYSQIKGNHQIILNLSTGVVAITSEGGGTANDTIAHFNTVYLLEQGNNTVQIDNKIVDSLAGTLHRIQAGGKNNNLDFTNYTEDLTVRAVTAGFDLSGSSVQIAFAGFDTLNAGKGKTTVVLDDKESVGVNVKVLGPVSVARDTQTTIDLSKLQGKTVYWAYNKLLEDGSDPSGHGPGYLTWGDGARSGNVISTAINEVRFNESDATVWGYAANHIHYVGSDKSVNTIHYDYKGFLDSITFIIDKDQQSAKFSSKSGSDTFTNFSHFVGSNQNDRFEIRHLDAIVEGTTVFDGAGGDDNVLSLRKLVDNGGKSVAITIDISDDKTLVLEDKDHNLSKKIEAAHLQDLELAPSNNTIRISKLIQGQAFRFKSISVENSNANRNNVVDIDVAGVKAPVTYNENNRSELVFDAQHKLLLNNFSAIRTTTSTGNSFYSSITSNMEFTVRGANDSSVNLVNFKHTEGPVLVDFTKGLIIKDGNEEQADRFSGINWFQGNGRADTYNLAFEMKEENNKNFKVIHINAEKDSNIADTTTISIQGLGAGYALDVAHQIVIKMEGAVRSSIRYDWYHVQIISLTDEQMVIAALDKQYHYQAIAALEGQLPKNAAISFNSAEGELKDSYIEVHMEKGGSVVVHNSEGKITNNGIFISGISHIIGTGSGKDIFYAGNANVWYDEESVGTGNYHEGATLTYSSYTGGTGLIFTFDKDNSAVITSPARNGKVDKQDKASGITHFIGTNGSDDTFVIAANEGAGIEITIDGNSGLYNKIDLSQVSGKSNKPIDTAKGLVSGGYLYKIIHVSTFQLPNGMDSVVIGSLRNEGFIDKSAGNLDVVGANIIIDGGTDAGKGNIFDYSGTYNVPKGGGLHGDKTHIINVNADLEVGAISKTGWYKSQEVTTIDTIGITYADKSVHINFGRIILSGDWVSNSFIANGGDNDPKAQFIQASVIFSDDSNIEKEQRHSIEQQITFENFGRNGKEANLHLIWKGMNLTGDVNGHKLAYSGFNSIIMGSGVNELYIINPDNLMYNESTKNTSVNLSAANPDITKSTLKFDLSSMSVDEIYYDLGGQSNNLALKISGHTYYYTSKGFGNLSFKAKNTKIMGTDRGNYNITFQGGNGVVDYSNMSAAYTMFAITSIDKDGAEATVDKISTSGKDVKDAPKYTDQLHHVSHITLTGNNDTAIITNNDNGPTIYLDAGGGDENTLSFGNWNGQVDLNTYDGSHVKVKGYDLKGFSLITLSKAATTIKLTPKSTIKVDAGEVFDNKRAIYVDAEYTSGVIAREVVEERNTGERYFELQISKESSTLNDTLVRFHNFQLVRDKSNTYVALCVNDPSGNKVYNKVDFNLSKGNTAITNLMDYSQLDYEDEDASHKHGLRVHFERGPRDGVIKAEVQRDKLSGDSIKDVLTGVTRVVGTTGYDDYNVDTDVRNLVLDIGNTHSDVKFTYHSDGTNNIPTFLWDVANGVLYDNNDRSNFIVNYGNHANAHVIVDLKHHTRIDNIFKINAINGSFNIDGSDASEDSVTTFDISTFSSSKNINIDIMFKDEHGRDVGTIIQVEGHVDRILALNVNSVIGSDTTANIFKIDLTALSSTRDYTGRKALVKGRLGSADDRLYLISRPATDFDHGFLGTLSSTELTLTNAAGRAYVTSTNVSHVVLQGGGAYSFKVKPIDNHRGMDYTFEQASNESNRLMLDFTAVTAKDFGFSIDKVHGTVLSSGSLHLDIIFSGLVPEIVLNDKSEGHLVVNSLNDLKVNKPIGVFNHIDLTGLPDTETISNIDFSYTDNQFKVKLNDLTFVNKKAIVIEFPAVTHGGVVDHFSVNKEPYFNAHLDISNIWSDSSQVMVLNIQGVPEKENQGMLYLTAGSKQGVVMDKLMLSLDNDVINMKVNDANNYQFSQISYINNEALLVKDITIKFTDHYNYISGLTHMSNDSSYAPMAGTVFAIRFEHLTIDFSPLVAHGMVNIQACSTGTLYGAFNGVIPSWSDPSRDRFSFDRFQGDKDQNFDQALTNHMYAGWTMIAPRDGLSIDITSGWITNYLRCAPDDLPKSDHKFIVDGTHVTAGHTVALQLNEDVNTYLHYFQYTVGENSDHFITLTSGKVESSYDGSKPAEGGYLQDSVFLQTINTNRFIGVSDSTFDFLFKTLGSKDGFFLDGKTGKKEGNPANTITFDKIDVQGGAINLHLTGEEHSEVAFLRIGDYSFVAKQFTCFHFENLTNLAKSDHAVEIFLDGISDDYDGLRNVAVFAPSKESSPATYDHSSLQLTSRTVNTGQGLIQFKSLNITYDSDKHWSKAELMYTDSDSKEFKVGDFYNIHDYRLASYLLGYENYKASIHDSDGYLDHTFYSNIPSLAVWSYDLTIDNATFESDGAIKKSNGGIDHAYGIFRSINLNAEAQVNFNLDLTGYSDHGGLNTDNFDIFNLDKVHHLDIALGQFYKNYHHDMIHLHQVNTVEFDFGSDEDGSPYRVFEVSGNDFINRQGNTDTLRGGHGYLAIVDTKHNNQMIFLSADDMDKLSGEMQRYLDKRFHGHHVEKAENYDEMLNQLKHQPKNEHSGDNAHHNDNNYHPAEAHYGSENTNHLHGGMSSAMGSPVAHEDALNVLNLSLDGHGVSEQVNNLSIHDVLEVHYGLDVNNLNASSLRGLLQGSVSAHKAEAHSAEIPMHHDLSHLHNIKMEEHHVTSAMLETEVEHSDDPTKTLEKHMHKHHGSGNNYGA